MMKNMLYKRSPHIGIPLRGKRGLGGIRLLPTERPFQGDLCDYNNHTTPHRRCRSMGSTKYHTSPPHHEVVDLWVVKLTMFVIARSGATKQSTPHIEDVDLWVALNNPHTPLRALCDTSVSSVRKPLKIPIDTKHQSEILTQNPLP